MSLFLEQIPSQLIQKEQLKAKTNIQFKQKIVSFFYYQNYIVCKAIRKVIVYHFYTKTITQIQIPQDQFILHCLPPYVFNCIVSQYLHLYNQYALDDPKQVLIAKISKMEVQAICKYNQAYYLGGYNRSVLPGGKRTTRRQVYYLQQIDPNINNKPTFLIKISPSQYPVSFLDVQSPFLIVYCYPIVYLFKLKTHQLLLTFQKDAKILMTLQGRYALNSFNGIGISHKKTIFTFDVESMPIYGVQITEHSQCITNICRQKTGKIYGCQKNFLFQYIPTKKITKCVKIYPQNQLIVWLQCTPNNNLLVLRFVEKQKYVVDAFSIQQS